jgi:Fic family protein
MCNRCAIRIDPPFPRWQWQDEQAAHYLHAFSQEVLREPVLYLSLFFKIHQRLYYDPLNETRESEGWAAWLDFFLQGLRDTAKQAVRTAGNIDKLFNADKEKIERFGRGAASALLVYRHA